MIKWKRRIEADGPDLAACKKPGVGAESLTAIYKPGLTPTIYGEGEQVGQEFRLKYL